MHAYLTEIHYVELAELNMSHELNINKIKDVIKELRKNTLKINLVHVCQGSFFLSI